MKSDSQNFPRITVVTPSFNQGAFIEETILSVIGQGYPNLEYIVMDGGSTDDTVEIIKKYEAHIAYWQSQPDGGQAAAINSGFRRATGDILAWINSDDFYFPGTLIYAAQQININASELLLGNCFHFNQDTSGAEGSDIVTHHAQSNLKLWDYIIQPSSFWTKQTWERVGELNENLNFAFDWDWFIRAQQTSAQFKTSPRYLSAYRFHEAHKTGAGGNKRRDELTGIYQTYSGEAYAQLFRDVYKSRSKINMINRRLNRLHLSFLANPVLKTVFPDIYRKHSSREIDDILAMSHD